MSRKTRSGRTFQNVDESTNEDDEEENVYPSTSSGSHRYLSQDSGESHIKKKSIVRSNRIGGRRALSQGSANLDLEEPSRERLQNVDSRNMSEQEELDLAGRVIRYLFVVEKKKHAILKVHIVKNILEGRTKNFRKIMEIVKSLLSNVFGYVLVDIGSGKYILVNEIKNELPHLSFTKPTKAQQVLLFIVLTHIFMCEGATREETLWDFLRRLDIIKEDSFQHEYFGDVKQLVTVHFITQHYLEKVTDKTDSVKYEYKWGPRAEHEVSRRDVLEFMSKVYGGRPIKNWMQQYKRMLAKEKNSEEER